MPKRSFSILASFFIFIIFSFSFFLFSFPHRTTRRHIQKITSQSQILQSFFLIFFLFPFPQHRSSQLNNHITITITNFRMIHLTIINLKKNQKKHVTSSAARRAEPPRARRRPACPRASLEGGPGSRAPPEGGLPPRGRRRRRAWPPRPALRRRGRAPCGLPEEREGEREDERT